ncbi:uncharacterized protein LOC142519616 [Primulina tabacum]|uniref:uncharacterized protein LOC142519616 n=1 Tax=Primulina tabacum TaxID=48773 RepID=UPI003F59CD17
MKEVNCRRWRNTLGFSGCFIVDSLGKSGGLMLLWKSSICVCIKSYSPGHIDCLIQEPDFAWRFTGFYGQPDISLRRFSWDLLRKLKRLPELCELPWLVGGDFNEICYDSEKLGGVRRSPSQMQEFRDALDVCELQDIHSHGDLYTWVNRRRADSAIFERLDRFVACLNWRLLFPTARANSLDFFHSDHRPICIEIRWNVSQNLLEHRKLKTLFRFEKHWLLESECSDVITRGWGVSEPHRPLVDHLSGCKLALQNWAANR